MQKITLAVAALTLVLGASISRAADQPSAGQPSAGQTAPGMTGNSPTDPGAPTMGGVPAAQTPPADWTSLNGTVQAVDASAKTVQIQDTTGNLVQVNVDKEVSIQKDGKKVKLTQVQAGDTITLAKKSSSNPSQPKAY